MTTSEGAELLPDEGRTGWYRFTGIAGLKRYVPAAIYDRWVAKGRTGYTKWYEPYPCICPKCDGPLEASSPEAVGEAVAFAHFQWNSGWEVWEQVSPEFAGEEGVIPLYRHPVAADREAVARIIQKHNYAEDAAKEILAALSPKGAGEATKPTQAEQLMRPQSGGVAVKPEGQLYNASDQGGE